MSGAVVGPGGGLVGPGGGLVGPASQLYFTADAVILRAQSGSITADAVLRTSVSGSITADAFVTAPRSGSLTANAVLAATVSGSFAANAVIRTTGAGSFTADAFLTAVRTGSFTADAIITTTPSGSITANAIVIATTSGSITADAFLAATFNGSLTADAIVRAVHSGSITANAVITATISGSITADSVLVTFTVVDGSITADAVVRTAIASSVAADAVITHVGTTIEGAFVGDAAIRATLPSSLTSAAVIHRTIAHSLTASAWIGEVVVEPGLRAIWAGTITAADVPISPTMIDLVTLPVGTYVHDIYVHTKTAFDQDALASFGWRLNNGIPDDPDRTPIFLGGNGFSVGQPNIQLWLTYGDDDTRISGNQSLPAASLMVALDSFGDDDYLPVVVKSAEPLQIQVNSSGPPTVGEADIWVIIGTVAAAPSLTIKANAVITDTIRGRFTASAVILKSYPITMDAVIASYITLNSVIKAGRSGVLTADALVRDPARPVLFADAVLRRTSMAGSFTADASLYYSAVVLSDISADAWIVGTPASFTADAQISSPSTGTGSIGADASISNTYRQATFSGAAVVRSAPLGRFPADAVIFSGTHVSGSFTANAKIAGHFTADAFIAGRITADALIVNPAWTFTADAVIFEYHQRLLTMDAVIANGALVMDAVISSTQVKTLPMLARISRTQTGSFTADARLAGRLTASAWIASAGGGLGAFTADAYITSGIGTKFWPPDGGPPIDAGGGGDYVPPEHKARIQVLIDGVDWTSLVIWKETDFSQAARVSPGQFTLTLRGNHQFIEGREVLVLVDGLRQYGGLSVVNEDDYVFSAAPVTKTVLRGLDFNCLLSRIYIYNVPQASGTTGEYEQIPDMPAGATDQEIIAKVESYIPAPWRKQLDFTSKVDSIGIPSPVEKFVIVSGQTLDQLLRGISQITNAVFWISPYYQIEYHLRTKTQAPFAIVEGPSPTGGVGCRDLTITRSIETMVNDDHVMGVLAKPPGGNTRDQIVFSHHLNQEMIDKYGFWPYVETRSDLHEVEHISRRAGSIISRKSLPLVSARGTIFESGFQAGMVATIYADGYDQAVNLVIRQIRFTVLLAQGTENGEFYGVPRYECDFGLDPEEPWNVYDALPFEEIDLGPFPRIRMPHLTLWNEGASDFGEVEICVDPPTDKVIFRDDFDREIENFADPRTWGDGGCGAWIPYNSSSNYASISLEVPPPWCITMAFTPQLSVLTANINVHVGNNIGFGDPTGYVIRWDSTKSQQAGTEFRGVQAIPWDMDLPVFLRIRRLLGSLELAIWPQNGSHEAIVIQETSGEATLWPISWLSIWIREGCAMQGIAVAAGGGGTGILWNEPNTIGTLVPPQSPPGTVAITPADPHVTFVPSYVFRQNFFDPARSWNVIHQMPNDVDFYGHPDDRVTISNGSRPANLSHVAWGWVAGFLFPLMALREIRYGWTSVILPPFVASFRLTGFAAIQVVEGQTTLGGFLHGVVPWVAYISGHYSGGPDWAESTGDEIANGNPVVTAGLFGKRYTDPHGFDSGEVPANSAFQQFLMRLPNEQYYADYFGGINFPNVMVDLSSPALFVTWGEPTRECGDKSPIGEWSQCESGEDPGVDFGWGSETRRVSKSGVFTSRLSADVATLQVYVRGKLLTPGKDWKVVDLDTFKTFQLTEPGPKCVRLVYLAPHQVIGSSLPTVRYSRAEVRADRLRLPDIRGL